MRTWMALPMLLIAAGAGPARSQSAVGTGSYLIFFGWGEPRIDQDAAAILDIAAAAYLQAPGGAILIAGHSDRSGAAGANRRAAAARAEAVRRYLTGRGISADLVSTVNNGEDQPLIATADGVREPQNRRVEITFAPAPTR